MHIDLNCDLGEGFPNDAALMPLISSANIACGFHAGDTETMRRTINMAVEHGVAIGAHPGFADKENFGRKEQQLSQQAYYDLVLTQLEAIDTLVRAAGGSLHHVKPHGALYNMAARDQELAYIIAHAVLDFNPALMVYGLSGSHSIRQAAGLGLKTASEVFADRSYQPNGMLTPRSQPGALIPDAASCIEQVLQMVRTGQVRATDGSLVSIQAETVCLHGDGDHAVEFARELRQVFSENEIGVRRP